MAAVWGGEGQVTGEVADESAATEWLDAEAFEEVSGYSISLSQAVGVDRVKVEATPSPLTDHKFESEFDDAGLKEAGFSGSVPFEHRINVLRVALNGDDSMAVELTADGSHIYLHISVSVASVLVAEYNLSLKRSALSRSDKLAAELYVATLQLAAARIELAAAKATIQKMQLEMDALSTEIRSRDRHIAKLESVATAIIEPTIDSVLKFKFDVATAKGSVNPREYKVSEDLLTATKKAIDVGLILLSPSIATGIHSLQLRVGKRTSAIVVAAIDEWHKHVQIGCSFYDDGDVFVSGSRVAKSQSFGRSVGFEKDDVFTLTIDMESFKFTIKSPYGSYEQKWQPRTTPVRVAVRMLGAGTSLSIVN